MVVVPRRHHPGPAEERRRNDGHDPDARRRSSTGTGRSPTARVSQVIDRTGAVTIRTNGKPDAAANVGPDRTWISGDELTMVLAATLPLRYNPGARDIAVIGFGSGMTTATFLDASTIERVDTIEIEPLMIVVIGSIIGAMIVALYMPIFSLMNVIS